MTIFSYPYSQPTHWYQKEYQSQSHTHTHQKHIHMALKVFPTHTHLPPLIIVKSEHYLNGIQCNKSKSVRRVRRIWLGWERKSRAWNGSNQMGFGGSVGPTSNLCQLIHTFEASRAALCLAITGHKRKHKCPLSRSSTRDNLA